MIQPIEWLQAALGFLFPEACQICAQQRSSKSDGYVCAQCWANVRFIKPPYCERCGLPFCGELTTSFECTNCHGMELHFSAARSAVVAKGVVLEAIHRYKYRRAMWFEMFLADLLVREAAPTLPLGKWDWIVPVPLHPAKLREREFNQAAQLAKPLGIALNLPVQTRVLRRVLPTQTQTRLSRHQRAGNVRNAFAVLPGVRLQGKRIVLVDDVFTTGATTSACAQVLRAAGAGEVCVWTVARGI